jgi:MFS family permease
MDGDMMQGKGSPAAGVAAAGGGAAAPQVRLSRRHMTLLTGVLVYALLSYSITSNMLIPLLPELEHSLRISPVTAIWVTLIALLSGAAFVPALCRLGDTLGLKKSMAIAGLSCLAVGGLLAAVSSSIPLLLTGRALQGVALLAFPMIAGIVNDEFTITRRKVAVSLLSATLFFGSGAGGVAAGLLVEHAASFRLVFWLSAALPLAAIPLLAVAVPRGRGPAADAPASRWKTVDLAGAAGFAIPAIALDIAFSEGPAWGWRSGRIIGLYVTAAVVLAAWVVAERRIASPLVDMKIFWSRTIWVNNAVSVLAGFGIFGAAIATSTFVQMPPVAGLGGFGYSAVTAALIVLPAEWMMLAVGPAVGYLSRRAGKGPFLTGGALVEALGLALVAAYHASAAEVVIAMVVVGLGVGAVAASFGLIYVEDVPPEHVGRLFGISPILAQGVGGSLAGAVFGAFLSGSHLGRTPLPREAAFTDFWLVAIAACLLATALASIYLVTHWAGLRGGDRAMVRREELPPVAAGPAA